MRAARGPLARPWRPATRREAVGAVLYFALFVAMAVIAAAAFRLRSAREARRWAERRARMAEPVLSDRAPVRPQVRYRPP